jgi:hypothetical protein
MTKANLLGNGQAFVIAFTDMMVGSLKSQPKL